MAEKATVETEPPRDHARYRAPEGFAGYRWGQSLTEFDRFAPDPLYVQTVYSRGKVTDLDIMCMPIPKSECDPVMSRIYQMVEGEGFHAMAEYSVESQAFRLRDEDAGEVALFPVTYMFCAQWGGFSGQPPNDIQARMKLCGMRFWFKSENSHELQIRNDDDYVTGYEHVLNYLIDRHRRPEHYDKRTRIIITTPNERITAPRKRRFNEWRWCTPRGRELSPSCDASAVLAFDPETGVGTILYATTPVWQFAYARHNGGAKNDSLYKLLHGLQKYSPVNEVCTGTYLCRPDPPGPMPEKTKAMFRLPRAATSGGPASAVP